MKPPPGTRPGQSYSLREAAEHGLLGRFASYMTWHGTTMFMLSSLHILVSMLLLSLGEVIVNQAVMITQQEAILTHCRAIETMLFDDRDELRKRQLGRSYLRGRPAAEIDRIIDRKPAYLPRAP